MKLERCRWFCVEFQRQFGKVQIFMKVDQFVPGVKEFVAEEICGITQFLVLRGNVAPAACFMGGVCS